jgi:hypothetical protein
MSLIFEITLNGEPHEIEVTRDGELIFLDYDIKYDEACLEFQYPDTEATRLQFAWRAAPVETLIYEIAGDSIERKHLARIAIEYAERVLWIEEKVHPKNPGVRNLLDASREYLLGTLSRRDFRALRMKMKYLGSSYVKHESDLKDSASKSRMSAHAASHVAILSDEPRIGQKFVLANVYHAATDAARAAAYYYCASTGMPSLITGREITHKGHSWRLRKESPSYETARASEGLWQLQRFVDVIEAVSQDLPWPPLEATP